MTGVSHVVCHVLCTTTWSDPLSVLMTMMMTSRMCEICETSYFFPSVTLFPVLFHILVRGGNYSEGKSGIYIFFFSGCVKPKIKTFIRSLREGGFISCISMKIDVTTTSTLSCSVYFFMVRDQYKSKKR